MTKKRFLLLCIFFCVLYSTNSWLLVNSYSDQNIFLFMWDFIPSSGTVMEIILDQMPSLGTGVTTVWNYISCYQWVLV